MQLKLGPFRVGDSALIKCETWGGKLKKITFIRMLEKINIINNKDIYIFWRSLESHIFTIANLSFNITLVSVDLDITRENWKLKLRKCDNFLLNQIEFRISRPSTQLVERTCSRWWVLWKQRSQQNCQHASTGKSSKKRSSLHFDLSG